MKTTVKHEGSDREWEGNLKQWEKHQECIIHWCDGGDVEGLRDNNVLVEVLYPVFAIEKKYRKKQRYPKAGEVWGINNTLWIRVIDCGGTFNGWVEIGGSETDENPDPADLEFLANNPEEYYKKRLLSD